MNYDDIIINLCSSFSLFFLQKKLKLAKELSDIVTLASVHFGAFPQSKEKCELTFFFPGCMVYILCKITDFCLKKQTNKQTVLYRRELSIFIQMLHIIE